MKDISALSDQELMELFDSIDEKSARKLLTSIDGVTSLVKGFRKQNIPLNMLKNAAITCSRGNRKHSFYAAVNGYVSDVEQKIEASKSKWLDKANDDKTSYALALKDHNKEFSYQEFLKLWDANDEVKNDVRHALTTLGLLSIVSVDTGKKNLDEETIIRNAGKISKVDEKANENQAAINNLRKDNVDLRKSLDELSASYQKLFARVAELEKDSSRIDSISKGLETNGRKTDELASSVKSLQNESANLSKDIQSCLSKSQEVIEPNLIFETIPAGSFDRNDGTELADIVSDVAGGMLSKSVTSHFDLYRSFIIDALYGDKLLFAAKDKAVHLARVISGIVSGQEYHHIVCDEDVSGQELYNFISKRVSQTKLSVFLIDGFVGRGSFSGTAKKLRKLLGCSKFIFSINDEKSVRFLPTNILDDFYFFDAAIDPNGKSDYLYICDLPKMSMQKNNELVDCLTNIGLTGFGCPDTVADGLGLMRYSYLPFVAYHDGKLLDDVALEIRNLKIKDTIRDSIDE